ncbi:carboxypeptidase-like regulatory domain-containing protein [Acidicapsa dinghuensis]|uniref:Carboxypeptidase-like regulatory domain-containing protein n=1 Tax=Acidicapsa dinghuensis TaxID=2218256 RepID=A0ABW1EL61_9BACT|nr:carboxypeptidase-like regulatory domain-containing protein [Acidicapsa dinghuensis]
MSQKKLLASLTVSNPCTESWDAMQGDARSRHCAHCDKDVHNLATMSPKAIEDLVIQTGGKFCGRVTRRFDESLVTLEGIHPKTEKTAKLAGFAASLLIAVGSTTALAKTAEEGNQTNQAILTGTVLAPNGSVPVGKAQVMLTTNSGVVVTTTADENGAFRLSANPGTYTIAIRQNLVVGRRILAVTLHEGLQILQPTRTHVGEMVGSNGETYALMGIMDAKIGFSFRGAIRHPVSYLKYLARKI